MAMCRREYTMVCNTCGKDNPANRKTCWNCGGALAGGLPTTPKPARLNSGPGKAVMIYGYLYVVASAILLIGAVLEMNSGGARAATVALTAFFQAVLFGVTGRSILTGHRWAVALVWVATVLGAIGVLFRGLVPLDLLLWLTSLGLAVWYTKKTRSIARRQEIGNGPEVMEPLDRVLVPSGRPRDEEGPTLSRQVGVPTQLETPCSAPATTPPPRAHEVGPHGSGIESSTLDSRVAPTRTGKLFKVAGVVVVIVAAAFGCVLLMRPFIRYKFLNEGSLQFRYDRYSGRTDQLVPTEGWVPVGFNRPSEEVPTANIQLSGMRWLGNRVCAEVNNESDYLVKSVIVQMCVNAKGCDQDMIDQALQARDGALTLSLQPVGYLLQKGETGRFCAEAEEAAYPAYTVLGAKGWKQK